MKSPLRTAFATLTLAAIASAPAFAADEVRQGRFRSHPRQALRADGEAGRLRRQDREG